MTKHLTVLVTGTRGLLGSEIAHVSASQGMTILPFEGDITTSEDCTRNAQKKFDWIIHAAAMTSVDECEKDRQKAFRVNVEGTKRIRDIAQEKGAGFLYISTASVFDGTRGMYTEEDAPNPLNYYSETKYLGEMSATEYEHSRIVRLNVIGIHPTANRKKNFLEWLVHSFTQNRDVTLFTDAYINPLSAPTLGRFLGELVTKNPSDRLFHLGSRDSVSKAGLGYMVKKYFPKSTSTVSLASIDTRSGAPRGKNISLNVNRISCILGPMPTIADDLQGYLPSRI